MDEARYFLVIVLAATHLCVALLMAVVTSMAASGRLRRNQYTGIRTPSTMRSDRAWVAGHGAAQRLTPLFFAVALLAWAVLGLALVLSWPPGLVMGAGVLTFVPLIAAAIYTAVVAGRAARSADESPAPGPG